MGRNPIENGADIRSGRRARFSFREAMQSTKRRLKIGGIVAFSIAAFALNRNMYEDIRSYDDPYGKPIWTDQQGNPVVLWGHITRGDGIQKPIPVRQNPSTFSEEVPGGGIEGSYEGRIILVYGRPYVGSGEQVIVIKGRPFALWAQVPEKGGYAAGIHVSRIEGEINSIRTSSVVFDASGQPLDK